MSWNQLTPIIKRGAYRIALCFCLVCVFGCSIPSWDLSSKGLPDFDIPGIGDFTNRVEEVSPPELVQQLKAELAASTPKVEIIEPLENSTIETQSVEIKLSVAGLSLYKDSDLGLGPHIAVVLDKQSPIEVHDLSRPIIVKDLKPGSHTIRAIAEYPWHESFKNPSAYAQRSFNILTPSRQNAAEKFPILTTSSIQERYTAEPILLDFIVRQANSNTGADSTITTPQTVQVKATLNDQSFIIADADSSLYLEGIKTGQNWIKLELENNQGKLAAGPFSEQTFGFQFAPEQSSPLGKVFSEELSLLDAGGIVGHPKPLPPKAVTPKPISSEPINIAPKVEPRSPSPMSSPQAIPGKTAPSGVPLPDQNTITKTSVDQTKSKIQPTTPSKVQPFVQAIEKPTKTPIKPLPKAEPSVAPTNTKKKSSRTITTSKTLPTQAKATDNQVITSTPVKAPSSNKSQDSIQPKKEEGTLPAKQNQSKANQLSDQFQAIRQKSQGSTNQNLKNWSDRFRSIKAEATSRGSRPKRSPAEPSPSPSTQPNPSSGISSSATVSP